MITKLVLIGVAIFVIGVISRIIALQRRSKEIEKTLDYTKMREWQDEED